MELNMVAGSAERCWDKYARLEGSRCEDRGCSALAARLYALLLSVDGVRCCRSNPKMSCDRDPAAARWR